MCSCDQNPDLKVCPECEQRLARKTHKCERCGEVTFSLYGLCVKCEDDLMHNKDS
jgi:uncharacterized protein YlaI